MKKQSYRLVCLSLLVVFCGVVLAQQPPSPKPPANVNGKWTLYCKDPNGTTSTKYLDLQQEGTNIKGGTSRDRTNPEEWKATIDVQHLVVRTKTRNVLVFRGRVDGSRVDGVVQATTFNGTFHDRGGTGSFQGRAYASDDVSIEAK